MISLAMHGLCASESYFVVHVFLSIGHLKMIQEMLGDLNIPIGSKDENLKKQINLKKTMSDFLFEHQEHFRFSRRVEELFAIHNLIMVVTASVLIVCGLVILVDQQWLVGQVLLVVALWQILFITKLGAVYEEGCEEFEKATYNVHWYLLAPKDRKTWRLVIQMAQNPRLISIGGLWDANLNSFIKVRVSTISSELIKLLRTFRTFRYSNTCTRSSPCCLICGNKRK